MRPSSALLRSNPLVHRLRRHKAMATLYRSIDEEMVIDDGNVAYQAPAQPGKPTVMASLVLDREAGAAEHLPAKAEIRPEVTQPPHPVAAPPAVQRQPRLPATPPSSSPSPSAEKAATQAPIPTEGSTTDASESTDFDWMAENEWTRLKSFMEGHQKKLSDETGGAKDEPVQRSTEDVGREVTQEKTQAELARRQELARRGQLPRAKVEYLSGEEGPGSSATEPSSSTAAEPVQRLPEEPQSGSTEPEAESGIEQRSAPVDEAASIPAAAPPIVQRTPADTSSAAPKSRSTLDAPSSSKPVDVATPLNDDQPEMVVGPQQVVAEPGSTGLEEAVDIQRAAEVATSSPKTGEPPAPEAASDTPTPESAPGTGLGNRILAAARSLFRGDADQEESPSSAVEVESDTTPDIETPATPAQEFIQRAPVEGEPIVEAALVTAGIDLDPSPESVDDAISSKVPDEAGSSATVIDPSQDPGLDSVGVAPDKSETVQDRAMPTEAIPTGDVTADDSPGLPAESLALELPKTGPASGTSPDISRKPADSAVSVPGARSAAAEMQPKVEPAQSPESADPTGTDETIIGEPVRDDNSDDEVDTIIQEPQGPAPEAQPPMLQRKEVAESPQAPEVDGPAGKVEPSINEPAQSPSAVDEDDTVIQRTTSALDSRVVNDEGLELPQVPAEPEYQPGLETDLSDRPTQALPLDAVWPVEKTEPPTIAPPLVKQGDAPSPGPAVQRKPAGDDMVGDKLHSALKDVAPGQPTDSSIELVTPRRPRPVPPTRPQPPAADVQRKPVQTPPPPADSQPPADQAAPGEKESPYPVSTEVGDLPSDFWEYLGEEPPPPSSEKSLSQDIMSDQSPTDLQRDVEPSQPLVTTEFPIAGVQRDVATRGSRDGGADDTGESGDAEDTTADQQDLDISELARQVFPEIKRRLNVDWERGRGRF